MKEISIVYCLIAIFFVFLWAGKVPSFCRVGYRRRRRSLFPFALGAIKRGRGGGERSGREVPFVLTFVAVDSVLAGNVRNNVVSS